MNITERRDQDPRKDDPHPGLPPFEDHESPYRVLREGKENTIFATQGELTPPPIVKFDWGRPGGGLSLYA